MVDRVINVFTAPERDIQSGELFSEWFNEHVSGSSGSGHVLILVLKSTGFRGRHDLF